MKLLLTKTEQKRGMLGGKIMFSLVAKVECTDQEKEAIDHFRLSDVTFYKSDADDKGPKQYMGTDAAKSLLVRLTLKQSALEITGMNLRIGMSFENESLVHLMDLEDKVIRAADFFSQTVARSLKFMGEQKIDLPLP